MGNNQTKNRPIAKQTSLHRDLKNFLYERFVQIPENITFKQNTETIAVFKRIAIEFQSINNQLAEDDKYKEQVDYLKVFSFYLGWKNQSNL